MLLVFWAQEATQIRCFFPSYNNIKYYFVPNFTKQKIKTSKLAVASFFFIYFFLALFE